ncbi:MAG: tyrosine-type recombinase/integrase [Ignavibacteriae bacterium]|nr:tyrosine-type recombinase/integrase [Ignavibacteriota bacterium]
MAFLSNRDGVYYICWEDDTRKRHYRSTKCKLKARAQTVLRRFINEGNEFQERKKIYLTDYINYFLKSINNSLEFETCRAYRNVLKSFLQFIGIKYMHQLSIEDIINYTNEKEKTINNTSINIHLRHIKAFIHKARESNFIYSDWYKKIKFKKLAEKSRIAIAREDIKIIIDDTEDLFMKEIIMYGYMTGSRRTEIVNQTWENIDFNKMVIKISNTDSFHTKSKKNRIIPISHILAEMLREKFYREQIINKKEYAFRYKDRKINAEHVTKYFKRVLNRNGYDKKITFHSLRHSFITNLINAGTDINTVKELAGHDSITTTAQYIHTTNELKRKAVELL